MKRFLKEDGNNLISRKIQELEKFLNKNKIKIDGVSYLTVAVDQYEFIVQNSELPRFSTEDKLELIKETE